MSSSLVHRLHDFGAWRTMLANRIHAYRKWLTDSSLADPATDARLGEILGRLTEDKLTLAFVAEFSRGKSELINSIFFADYGRRMLASSTGRTTMCPTELMWDSRYPPQVMLLPIETRAQHTSTSEYKRFPEEWNIVPLDLHSPDSIVGAFQKVCETKLVPLDEAKNYALFTDSSDPSTAAIRTDGMVEIPCWRHAVVNFPHPLLEQGLVILDTPGLNAIGTEPELTLNLLPNAHAVLFILAVDTGVTQSDLQVWRDFIVPAGGSDRFRFAVLNKIDSLWDGMRDEEQIALEVAQQVRYCAETLDIDAANVYPVSAQKGLLAKITRDEALLERSQLGALEHALSTQLIPHRQAVVRASTRSDVADVISRTRKLLVGRVSSIDTQIDEIHSLKGRNLDVVQEMVRRVRQEKAEFERGLATFQGVRSEYSTLANTLFEQLGMDALNEEAKRTLLAVKRARFTAGVRSALSAYFEHCRGRLDRAGRVTEELHSMMAVVYQRFETDHRLMLGTPPNFSMTRFQNELARLERLYHQHFDTLLAMLTTEALTLLQKFFETIATQVRRVFAFANREAETWLRAVIGPVEIQIREHQGMLRRRLDSIRKVHNSTETLDERIHELEHGAAHVKMQVEQIDRLTLDIEQLLAVTDEEAAQLAVAA
jgi:predicted GTPase